MNKKEILEFINANPAFHLATVEGDQPRCRGMLLFRADTNGILFHSGTMKAVHHQIEKNPKVELCFNDLPKGVQVRVAGKLEIVEDNELYIELRLHAARLRAQFQHGYAGRVVYIYRRFGEPARRAYKPGPISLRKKSGPDFMRVDSCVRA